MGHQPERTCTGCRGAFSKSELIRLVAGPTGVAVDYREKLPGRGAYVCPRAECIRKALAKGGLSRFLRSAGPPPTPVELTDRVRAAVVEKIKSLIVMAAKAGMLASGYSAVRDGIEKGKVSTLIFAADIAEGTKEKVELLDAARGMPRETLFTREELGRMLGRELVGVVGIEERGFADAVRRESLRLKSLINSAW